MIAFLPSITQIDYEYENHKEALKVLEKRQATSSGQFKYMWVNASCHDSSYETFGLGPTQLPTLVLYSPSQNKYAQMTNSITDSNLNDFEKAFLGEGGARVSINDFEGEVRLRDVECQELQMDSEEGVMDADLEAEIMAEILAEEQERQ